MDYGQFKVVSVGAKDCKAPVICSLQGDKACLEINRPVNGMTSYEVDFNTGEKESYADEKQEHRMLHEFKEFIRIVDEKDMETAEKMLKISLDVSYVLTTARKSAGIVFPMDEQGV